VAPVPTRQRLPLLLLCLLGGAGLPRLLLPHAAVLGSTGPAQGCPRGVATLPPTAQAHGGILRPLRRGEVPDPDSSHGRRRIRASVCPSSVRHRRRPSTEREHDWVKRKPSDLGECINIMLQKIPNKLR
jgi:hypothetical protein